MSTRHLNSEVLAFLPSESKAGDNQCHIKTPADMGLALDSKFVQVTNKLNVGQVAARRWKDESDNVLARMDTDNTIQFDPSTVLDFQNCTIQNLAVGGGGNTLDAAAINSNNYPNQSVDYELDQLTSAQGTINNAITGLTPDRVMVSSGGGNLVPSGINPITVATTNAPVTFTQDVTCSADLKLNAAGGTGVSVSLADPTSAKFSTTGTVTKYEFTDVEMKTRALTIREDETIPQGLRVFVSNANQKHMYTTSNGGGAVYKHEFVGPVNATDGYQVNGTDLDSTHLTDTADIARLNNHNVFTQPIDSTDYLVSGAALDSTHLADTTDIARLTSSNVFTQPIDSTGYKVSGADLASTHLADGADLVKRAANGSLDLQDTADPLRKVDILPGVPGVMVSSQFGFGLLSLKDSDTTLALTGGSAVNKIELNGAKTKTTGIHVRETDNTQEGLHIDVVSATQTINHTTDGDIPYKHTFDGPVSTATEYQVAGVALNSTHLSDGTDLLKQDPTTRIITSPDIKGFDTKPATTHLGHFEFRHEAVSTAPSDPATSRLNVVSKFDTVSGTSYIDKPLMTLHSGLQTLSEETVEGLTTDVLPDDGVYDVDDKSGHVQFQRDVQMLGDPATILHLNDRDTSEVNSELGITDARVKDCYPRLQRTRTGWYNSLAEKGLYGSAEYESQLPTDTTEHPHDRYDSLQFAVGKRGDFVVSQQTDKGDSQPILKVGRDLAFSMYKDNVTPTLQGLYSVPFVSSGSMKETDWNTMSNPTLAPAGCGLQAVATRNWCMNSGQLSARFHKYVIELCSQGLPNANPAVGDLQADYTSHRTTWPEWNDKFEPIRLYGEKQTADPNQTPTPGAVDFTNPRLRQHELGHTYKNPITITQNKHVWAFRQWPYEKADPNQNKTDIVTNTNDQFVYNFTVAGVTTTHTITIPVKAGGYSLFELFDYIKNEMTATQRAQLTITVDTRPAHLTCTITTGAALEVLFDPQTYINAFVLMAQVITLPTGTTSIAANSSVTGFSSWMTKVEQETLPEIQERQQVVSGTGEEGDPFVYGPVPNAFTVDCTSTMSQIELKTTVEPDGSVRVNDITQDDGTGTQSGGLFARTAAIETTAASHGTRLDTLEASPGPPVVSAWTNLSLASGFSVKSNAGRSADVSYRTVDYGAQGKQVFLRGVVQATTGSFSTTNNTAIFTLPTTARPSHLLDVIAAAGNVTSGGTAAQAYVFIHSYGTVEVFGLGSTDTSGTTPDPIEYVSLNNISFWTT